MEEKDGCILACVTVQKECGRLIRHGTEAASTYHMPLHVIHVCTGKSMLGNPDAAEALNYLFSLSHEADAEMNVLYESDVPQAIAEYAKRNNAKTIIIGSDRSGIAATLGMLLPDREILVRPE